jgi:hypothetical protein
MINDRNKRFKLSGDVALRHSNDDNNNHSSGTNFLSGGDTYSRSHYSQRVRNTSVISNHNFDFKWKNLKLNVQPSFYYLDHHDRTASRSGTYGSDPAKQFSEGLLDSLLSPGAGSLLRRIMLCSQRWNSLTDSRQLNAAVGVMATVKMPFSDNDRLVLNATGSLTDNTDNTFSRNRVEYPSDVQAQTDFRNEYANSLYRSNAFSVRASYWLWVLKGNRPIVPYYEYGHSRSYVKHALYRLDRLPGWGADGQYEIGELPSVDEWRALARDGWNSRFEHHTDGYHTLGLHLQQEEFRDNHWRWDIELPFRFEANKMGYTRPAAIDTTFTRHVFLFSPSGRISNSWKGGKRQMTFSYSSTASAPSMTYLVDARDDSNPLNTVWGNGNLKNTRNHNVGMGYQSLNSEKERSLGMNMAYSIVQNAIAMGYVYDRVTGRRVSKPDKVNGNWNASASVEYSLPLDRAKHLTLNTNTNTNFYHNVDLISTADGTGNAMPPRRSTVRNLYLTESLKTEYRYGKYSVGIKASATWTNATSRRSDFSTVNAADISYGVKGQADLPWRFQLSTDLTMFSRRGYEDSRMNTDDLVWNARLAKRVMHGSVTFLLDGFDMLHQLSNVQRTLNGQGRTETYYNVIPRYLMLHVVCRLNKEPKRR